VSIRSVCRALLALNVLYCALAAAQEGLPGWHMFESVDRLEHELRDKDGARVDVRAYLPRGAWLTDRDELREIVRFVCEKERARAPFTFEDRARGTSAIVGPVDCRVPRDRAAR
jgi:hypothetical protein